MFEKTLHIYETQSVDRWPDDSIYLQSYAKSYLFCALNVFLKRAYVSFWPQVTNNNKG